ncbi:thioesterase family protein [Bradyrhizobium iriomotense]|uniref:thioesterase family protein n=1 Tax=Bradyrhizobium iriomotense TaxID=441950 RepID=UPI001B8A0A16|nr:thioesterase family protein [Bradyrhizobium iriomotense]MBR0784773.1 thioesterase family protein [Bradyrhizobium iriomotense]
MNSRAPFISSEMIVDPSWVDYNGHLNMAYYHVLLDRAADEFWLQFGLGPRYVETTRHSTFTAECHIRYLRELHANDPVRVSIFLLAADEKRLHTFRLLQHAHHGWLSATSENMSLHVDLTLRRVVAFPAEMQSDLRIIAEGHRRTRYPEGIGRRISMRKEA